MKIGIIGSRGIPNNYGGFEKFAEYLSVGLVKLGCEVTVYCSHYHLYRSNEFKGVKLIHCFDPEPYIGTAGQFIYDLNCIIDCRQQNFDVIYQLGYTSSAIWLSFIPQKSLLVTNLDGLEWQRNKYSWIVRKFLKFSETYAVSKSKYLIADSTAIQDYVLQTYNKKAEYLAYGADLFNTPDPLILSSFNIRQFAFYLVIARLQPDNQIETIIKAVKNVDNSIPLLIVGSFENKYGRFLKKRYESERICFMGGIYDDRILNNLRHYTALYIHGHSAGGTNPSLLEAMAASSRVCAYNSVFNTSVLGENALFFQDEQTLSNIVKGAQQDDFWNNIIVANRNRIQEDFNWNTIIQQYFHLFTTFKSNIN